MSPVRDFQRGFGENLRFALLAVRAHKLRASLTVLGNRRWRRDRDRDGLDRHRVQQQHGPQLPELRSDRRDVSEVRAAIWPGGGYPEGELRRRELTIEDAMALKEAVPEMRAVSPTRYLWNNTDYHVRFRDLEALSPRVWGVTPDYPAANNRGVAEGRFLTESDVEPFVQRRRSRQRDPRANSSPASKRSVRPSRWDRFSIWSSAFSRRRERCSTTVEDNYILMPITTFDQHFPWIKFGVESGDALRIAAVPYRPEQMDTIIDKGRGDPARAPARAVQQAGRLRDRDSGQADRELPGDHQRRDDGHGLRRFRLASDRRRRRDEHHARVGDGAHPRDRRA